MKTLRADFKGIVTAPGILSRAEASCIDASNCVVDAPGVIRKRRGFERGTQSTVGNSWKIFSSREMEGNILVHEGGPTTGTVLAYGDGFDGGAPLDLIAMEGSSDLTRDGQNRMDCAVGGLSHYVTANEGVARIENDFTTNDQHFAGMPRGFAPEISNALSLQAGTALADGYARAHRVTWHRKTPDGTELGGAPTGRAVIRNQTGNPSYAAGAQAAGVYVRIPTEVGIRATTTNALDNEYFWRLWGTRTFNSAGGEQGDDEMYLVYEAYLTAADIAAGVVQYTDNTPDSYLLKQRRLHTNVTNFPQSELGLAQGTLNEDGPVPISLNVANWQDVMWYGGASWRSRLQLQMLAVPANNDTVMVTDCDGNNVTLTAKTTPLASSDFRRFTAFATTQLNIEATACALVEAINRECLGTSSMAAYYVSANNQSPGYIYFEATCIATGGGSGQISVTSSVATTFTLMDETGFAEGTTDDAPNGLYFSKILRPDAVPPVNFFTCGPKDSRILRLQPYRDRLFIFTDYGIYQAVGKSWADFAVMPFDLGYRLLAREAVAVCDERVYAWCYEGIIEITDGGISVISTPIEPTIQSAILALADNASASYAEAQAVFGAACFAVAYRQAHNVQFWYPQMQDDNDVNGCPYWLSYDTRTRAWTRGVLNKAMATGWLDTRNCGVVRFSDDLLVLGNWSSVAAADWLLFKERRDYASTDFRDDYSDGTSEAVTMSATFQYEVPEEEGAVHWQQTVVEVDGNEQSWRPIPTALTVAWEGDPTSLTSNGSITGNTVALIRVEVPQVCRRGNRLRTRILNGAEEYCGIVGLSQTYRPSTRFAQRSVS